MLETLLARVNRFSLWRKTLEVWGRPMRSTSLDRLVYLFLHKFSLMGKAEQRFFEEHVKPGMTVVDVGANLGVYTLLFSRLVGDSGRVIALEPDPLLFAALTENCSGMGNITLFNMAAGACTEQRGFCPGVLNSGDNRLAHPSDDEKQNGLRVNVAKLDDLVESGADFVKIDVQGWEMDVFRGMVNMLQTGVQVFFEYWPYGLRQAKASPEEVLQYLQSRGFNLRVVDSGREGISVDSPSEISMHGKLDYLNLFACRQPGWSGALRNRATWRP